MVASTPCDRSPCKFNVPYSRRDACGCSPSVPQFSGTWITTTDGRLAILGCGGEYWHDADPVIRLDFQNMLTLYYPNVVTELMPHRMRQATIARLPSDQP